MPEPGPGEIRVKLVLSPIHNHDLFTIRGQYGVKPPLPAIGGTEALGIVDALGPGVSAPALGQRVTMAGIADAWAEYFIAPAAARRAAPGSRERRNRLPALRDAAVGPDGARGVRRASRDNG